MIDSFGQRGEAPRSSSDRRTRLQCPPQRAIIASIASVAGRGAQRAPDRTIEGALLAAYTTETITPKYHEALVAWQKKNFPELEFLEKNWSKHYSQTPFGLFAKIGKLTSDSIQYRRT